MLVNGFICEGPRCKKGPNDQRVMIHWAADSRDIPDAAFRMITSRAAYEEPSPTQSPTGQPPDRTFCSAGCLRDFYSQSNYTPPRSPRELDAIREANANVERERNAELSKRASDPGSFTVAAADAPVGAFTVSPVTAPQADGDSTDLTQPIDVGRLG